MVSVIFNDKPRDAPPPQHTRVFSNDTINRDIIFFITQGNLFDVLTGKDIIQEEAFYCDDFVRENSLHITVFMCVPLPINRKDL